MATVSPLNFSKTIEKILDQYQQDVTESLEAGLDEAQDLLIKELQEASPKKTGDYAKHWKAGTGGKGYRRVINDKQVTWNGKSTHLAGILEYSTKHSHPHVQATRTKARPKIMRILKESINKGT